MFVAFHFVLCQSVQAVLQEHKKIDPVYAWTHSDFTIWLSALQTLLSGWCTDKHYNSLTRDYDYLLLLCWTWAQLEVKHKSKLQSRVHWRGKTLHNNWLSTLLVQTSSVLKKVRRLWTHSNCSFGECWQILQRSLDSFYSSLVPQIRLQCSFLHMAISPYLRVNIQLHLGHLHGLGTLQNKGWGQVWLERQDKLPPLFLLLRNRIRLHPEILLDCNNISTWKPR